MKEDINALDEIHKGCMMGKDAIDYVLDKVEDEIFKNEIEKEYNDYDQIANRIDEIYPNYNDGKPHDTSLMTKAMTWTSVEMKTMMDKSNSKIAELLLQGVNMGIIEGRKILNNKELNAEVSKIVSDYVNMQEQSVEKLKKYL